MLAEFGGVVLFFILMQLVFELFFYNVDGREYVDSSLGHDYFLVRQMQDDLAGALVERLVLALG
jgi:hypothetical protein